MDQQRLFHEVTGIQSMFNNLMIELFGLPYLNISSAMRSLFTNLDDRLQNLTNELSASTSSHSLKRDMPKGWEKPPEPKIRKKENRKFCFQCLSCGSLLAAEAKSCSSGKECLGWAECIACQVKLTVGGLQLTHHAASAKHGRNLENRNLIARPLTREAPAFLESATGLPGGKAKGSEDQSGSGKKNDMPPRAPKSCFQCIKCEDIFSHTIHICSSSDVDVGFRCLACEVDLQPPENLADHQMLEKHQENLDKATSLKLCWFKCGGCAVVFSSGKHSCSSPKPLFWCGLCKTMISNIFSLEAHNVGKYHQKNLRNWGNEIGGSSPEEPSSDKPQPIAQARAKNRNSVPPLLEVEPYYDTNPYPSANTVPVDMDISSEVSPLISFNFQSKKTSSYNF